MFFSILYEENHAPMFKYIPKNQLTIFNFHTDFESKLDPKNRWVKLAKLLDWDSLVDIYSVNFSKDKGAGSIDARVVIGALIIKHIECKDDRGTIAMIQENPYMQFFLGFDHFRSEPIFDPSLFVTIRKRLGADSFDKMNELILQKAKTIENNNSKSEDTQDLDDSQDSDSINESNNDSTRVNKGKVQFDATIADSVIKFPTDLNLLNDSREKSELIIDVLCKSLSLKKPRTYRLIARKEWLNLSKKKRKSTKEIRKGIKSQLNFLKRNLAFISKIVESNKGCLQFLKQSQYKILLVIFEIYRQQEQMYKTKTRSIENRIVSVDQPHIRPIVRGKQGRNVEFGAKINVSMENGYAFIDQFSFEAFNEGIYLINQIEKYKLRNGYYPELVQTDDIYMNRENRFFLTDNGIRHTGRPLGRKPKTANISKEEKKKRRQEKNERNQIEGKFGEAKRKYNLNKILAKKEKTAQSWIGAIFFVINILKLSRDIFWSFFKRYFFEYFYSKDNFAVL